MDSQPGTVKIDKPMLIIQRTADMSLPLPAMKGLYDAMLEKDSNVEFLPVLNATHIAVIVNEKISH